MRGAELIGGVLHLRVLCRTTWTARRMCERFPGVARREGGSPRTVWVPVTEVERVTDEVATIGYVSDYVHGVVRKRAADWIAYGNRVKEGEG